MALYWARISRWVLANPSNLTHPGRRETSISNCWHSRMSTSLSKLGSSDRPLLRMALHQNSPSEFSAAQINAGTHPLRSRCTGRGTDDRPAVFGCGRSSSNAAGHDLRQSRLSVRSRLSFPVKLLNQFGFRLQYRFSGGPLLLVRTSHAGLHSFLTSARRSHDI